MVYAFTMTPQEKQEKKGKLLVDQDLDDLDHTDHTFRLDPIAAVMSLLCRI